MKIALVCGGPSSEHEVSLMSTRAILASLGQECETWIFYITRNLQCCFFKASGELTVPDNGFLPLLKGISQLQEVDLCLLAGIHGEFVEDGRLQGLFDLLNIHYSGSGAAASSFAMDKYRSSLLVKSKVEVLIPETIFMDNYMKQIPQDIKFPVVCKPNNLGSSVGVTIAYSNNELNEAVDTLRGKDIGTEILFQEYISDATEISCGCLESKSGEFTRLPPIEITPFDAGFFDYSSKYEARKTKEVSPPISISQEVAEVISSLACEIHALLGCKLYSRSDFLIKDDSIYYLETNTLPGMTTNSLIPKEAQAAGISFQQLLRFLIENS